MKLIICVWLLPRFITKEFKNDLSRIFIEAEEDLSCIMEGPDGQCSRKKDLDILLSKYFMENVYKRQYDMIIVLFYQYNHISSQKEAHANT